MRMTYVGMRITTANKLSYFWLEEGQEKPKGYRKQIAPAVIGEIWQFTMHPSGGITISGPDKPKQLRLTDSEHQVTQWIAESEACEQHAVGLKTDKILKARKSEFDKAIAPLKRMLDTLSYHNDKAAFIARVTSELWRR